MNALHSIRIGTRFKGNVNGCLCMVVNIERGRRGSFAQAIVLDEQTGKKHVIGLETLKRCDITILKD